MENFLVKFYWSKKSTGHLDENAATVASFEQEECKTRVGKISEKCGYSTLRRLALNCDSELFAFLSPWTILFASYEKDLYHGAVPNVFLGTLMSQNFQFMKVNILNITLKTVANFF